MRRVNIENTIVGNNCGNDVNTCCDNHNIIGETNCSHNIIDNVIDNSKVNIINASLRDTVITGHKLYANRPECHIIADNISNDNINIIKNVDINAINTEHIDINIINDKINDIKIDAADIDINNDIIDEIDIENIKKGINTKTITSDII
ncbi:MAG: hypothetical protein QMC67_06115 [Candidatus Wallbacteria bacterium]